MGEPEGDQRSAELRSVSGFPHQAVRPGMWVRVHQHDPEERETPPGRFLIVTANRQSLFAEAPPGADLYSHSIVAGGFDEMS